MKASENRNINTIGDNTAHTIDARHKQRQRSSSGGSSTARPTTHVSYRPMTPNYRSRVNVNQMTDVFIGSTPCTSPTGRFIKSVGASPTLPTNDMLRTIYSACLPALFDALGTFHYQQANVCVQTCFPLSLRENEWKNRDVFDVMIRLAASCECTYHLMRYLDTNVIETITIDQLYNKLVVVLNHLVDEVHVVIQSQQRLSKETAIPQAGRVVSESIDLQDREHSSGKSKEGELEYYADLLDQAAEFFALRIPMIELYRTLATAPAGHQYDGMAKILERLLQRISLFQHPLLVTLRDSSIRELETVKAAFESEVAIAQYMFTSSMVTLHRLKIHLRRWSDHIDSISEYPKFADDGEVDEVESDEEEVDEYSSSQELHYDMMIAQAPLDGVRRQSFMGESSGSSTRSQNPLSRLITQQGLILKRGFSMSSLRSTIAAVGNGVAGLRSSSPPLPLGYSTPTNTLEHAILNSSSTPAVGTDSTPAAGGNGATSVAPLRNSSGFNINNCQTLAAEMIASAVAKQEREDGYALPLYQWSKRFYRSLVAKFTLYFHRWIEPLENRSDDVLSPYDLTRFVRSPVGISYLQLIDVLLAKGGYRGDDGSATILLVLETQKLPDKGTSYYPHGYLCPGSSNQANNQRSDTPILATSDRVTRTVRGNISGTNSPLYADMATGIRVIDSPVDPTSSTLTYPLFSNVVEPEVEDDPAAKDFTPLWGLSSWPAVFCYPQSTPPLQHWPNIVSLIMDNRPLLEPPVLNTLTHTERRIKTCYYIKRVDPAIFLVLILEGKRRPNERTTQDFMQTLTENLQHSGVFERHRVAVVSSSNK